MENKHSTIVPLSECVNITWVEEMLMFNVPVDLFVHNTPGSSLARLVIAEYVKLSEQRKLIYMQCLCG